ncbi:MAG: WYL domain-containing protein, partial [Fimbriimonadaceae bacterium]|nr:WYL domain-containing protein [Fimbriimonadaceae bacterium]
MRRTRSGIPIPHARPPLERMLRIHARLRDGGKVNCSTLAEDLEVCTKTVQRDIDFMRDRMGLPIEYNPREFTYRYTEPVDQFPTVKVTEGELVALFVARKAVTQYHGTPFARPLRAAFEKITQGLTEHLSFSWGELDSAISFRSIGIPREDLDLFEKLSEATVKSQEVTFEYRKLSSATHQPRRVQPYHLACIDHQWYLVAHDLDRSALRNFVLTRLKNVR